MHIITCHIFLKPIKPSAAAWHCACSATSALATAAGALRQHAQDSTQTNKEATYVCNKFVTLIDSYVTALSQYDVMCLLCSCCSSCHLEASSQAKQLPSSSRGVNCPGWQQGSSRQLPTRSGRGRAPKRRARQGQGGPKSPPCQCAQ